MQDSSQEGEKVVELDTQCSSDQTHGVPKKKKSIVVILRNPEKFTTKQDGSTLKTLFIGPILGGHMRKV